MKMYSLISTLLSCLLLAVMISACANKPVESGIKSAAAASAGGKTNGSEADKPEKAGIAANSGTAAKSASKETTADSAAPGGDGAAVDKSDFPLTVTDQAGHKATIPAQPKHIASITEGTDEILSALVPRNRLAMVTSVSSDPQFSNITGFVKGIPQLKEAQAEPVIAVKPDLVMLASYTKQGVVNQIKQAGIPVYEFSDFNSIASIEKNIRIVGRLTGEDRKAGQLVAKMENKLQAVADAVKKEKKVTVLDYSHYRYAAGRNTTVNEIITDAGGINAASGMNGWQKISDEEIVKLNPDVIIVADNDKGFRQTVLKMPALQSVKAVKNKRVIAVDGADLSSVSQYIVNGVADMAHALYPDVKLP